VVYFIAIVVFEISFGLAGTCGRTHGVFDPAVGLSFPNGAALLKRTPFPRAFPRTAWTATVSLS
jgi:hypothetical protein